MTYAVSPPPVVIEGAAAVGAAPALVLAIGPVRHFDASQIETNFNKLRRYDTWTNGAGFWGNKMDALLGHYLTPTVLLFDTPEQADAAEKLFAIVTCGSTFVVTTGSDTTAFDALPGKVTEAVFVSAL